MIFDCVLTFKEEFNYTDIQVANALSKEVDELHYYTKKNDPTYIKNRQRMYHAIRRFKNAHVDRNPLTADFLQHGKQYTLEYIMEDLEMDFDGMRKELHLMFHDVDEISLLAILERYYLWLKQDRGLPDGFSRGEPALQPRKSDECIIPQNRAVNRLYKSDCPRKEVNGEMLFYINDRWLTRHKAVREFATLFD